MNRELEQKSADRLAFEHYLRTGRRLNAAEWRAEERKVQPQPRSARWPFHFWTGRERCGWFIRVHGIPAGERRETLSGTF